MIHVVLHEPEIPQNTGNIARTCACTGARLHLIEPLGFDIHDRYLKRAGLDYWPHVFQARYPDLETFIQTNPGIETNMFLFTTHGNTLSNPAQLSTSTSDVALVFGSESRGLPQEVRDEWPERCIRFPMTPERRSLNLSNAVAIAVYWAWQNCGFYGSI